MKKLIYLLLILMLSLSVMPSLTIAQSDAVVERLEEYNSEIPPYGVISAEDLSLALFDTDYVLLDVREVEEYEGGHIEGAFNVPIRELTANLDLLPDLDANIAVICQGGARAIQASSALNVLGYSNAVTMAGGMGAWVGEDFPVTEEAFTVEAGEAPEFNEDVFAGVDAYLSSLPQDFGLVLAEGLAEELIEEDIFLLDVRSPEEFETGFIEGAEYIWVNEFMANLDLLPEDTSTNIVVYCATSYRGGIVMTMLKLLGYDNVRNLVDGINAWNAAGLPLVGVPEGEDMGAEEGEFDLVGAITDYVAGLPGNFNALRPSDFAAALEEDPLLVDVRFADEYAEGHVEGAINIPFQELTDNLDLLPDLDANIILYCGSGHRSAFVMEAMNLLGYTNVVSLMSGTRALADQGIPLVQDIPDYEGGEVPAVNENILPLVTEYLSSVPAGYYIVRADDLNSQLAEEDIMLIDVRTQGEYEAGYIEGAVHIPFSELMTSMDMWPEDMAANIVVYDNPTHRSSMAMMLMQLLGYENVRTLGGGTGAWQGAGLPLATE